MRGTVIRRNDEASVSIPTTLFTSIKHRIGIKHVVATYMLKTITEITVYARGSAKHRVLMMIVMMMMITILNQGTEFSVYLSKYQINYQLIYKQPNSRNR